MNKIEIIKKAIEAIEGKTVIVQEMPYAYKFTWLNDSATPQAEWVNKSLLQYLSDPLEEQPTCPCTILDEPCTPHCTCKEPFSSRGCYLCAQYGSEEQRKAKAKWIKERVMATVLEEQPDKGWIPVSEKLPEIGERVLLYGKGNRTVVALFTMAGNMEMPDFLAYDLKSDSLVICEEFTHWQPLPSAPVKQG